MEGVILQRRSAMAPIMAPPERRGKQMGAHCMPDNACRAYVVRVSLTEQNPRNHAREIAIRAGTN